MNLFCNNKDIMMINPENSSRVVTTYKANKANAVSDFLAKVRKWRKLF